jgi:hypothetical protein
MRRFLILVSIALLGSVSTVAREGYKHDLEFGVPAEFFNDPDFHPVGYLSSFPVKDTHAKLSPERKSALRRLFMAAYCACKAKLRQDYPLSTAVPLYRLLKANFPEVATVETEGGNIVMLGRLSESLEDVRP